MQHHLITKTCFGKLGVAFNESDEGLSEAQIVDLFLAGEFDAPAVGGRGLLQVLRVSPDAGTCEDATRSICAQASARISRDHITIGSNQLRLMVETGVVPLSVSAIRDGVRLSCGAGREAA